MVFLSVKFFSYRILDCIIDGIRDDEKLKNGSLLINIKHVCWAYGFFKDNYDYSLKIQNYMKIDLVKYKEKNHIEFEEKEMIFIKQLVILHYCLFLILLLLRNLKEKCNFLDPLIEKLKERCITNYSDCDVNQIKVLFKIALDKSRYYFIFICLYKLIYFGFLFSLIWSTKFLMYGQYPIETIDWNNLILFPELVPIELKQYDLKFTDLTMPNYLNIVFMFLWRFYLILSVLFFILILMRFIQYLMPSLRTKSILSYSPDAEVQILNHLNYLIGQYYILHKIARNIRPLYFSVLLDETVFIKNRCLDGKSDEDGLNCHSIERTLYEERNEAETSPIHNRPQSVNECSRLNQNYVNHFHEQYENEDQLFSTKMDENVAPRKDNLGEFRAKYFEKIGTPITHEINGNQNNNPYKNKEGKEKQLDNNQFENSNQQPLSSLLIPLTDAQTFEKGLD